MAQQIHYCKSCGNMLILPGEHGRSPQERKQEVIRLRLSGWSFRRISHAAGVSHETARQYCRGVKTLTGENGVEFVEGKDGRRYPARRSQAE